MTVSELTSEQEVEEMTTKCGASVHLLKADSSGACVKVWYSVGDKIRWHYFPGTTEKQGKAIVRAMVKSGKII